MATPRSQLLEGLAGPLAELGVDLEDVEVVKAGRRHVVRVVVDRDGGVDLDVVAEVSRRVSELMDASPLDSAIDGAYVLEVTSPGVDRPLTQPRHWRRAQDRLVQVDMVDGTAVQGRVAEVHEDATVRLAVGDDTMSLALADVSRAVVQVEFQRQGSMADETE